MKTPMIQYSDEEAHRLTEEFIAANSISSTKVEAPKVKTEKTRRVK
jgi:hypothetical protein